MELDHLFVCTALGAPEAEKLVHFGLREESIGHQRAARLHQWIAWNPLIELVITFG